MRTLNVALDPDPAWQQNPYGWEIPGTHLHGHAESPELASSDGLAAYTQFENQKSGWDG
jgi:hypothetical protein